LASGGISASMPECVFCGIAVHRSPAWMIEETPGAMAFLTIQPLAEGHALVIPRAHAETLDDVARSERSELWGLVHRVAERMRSTGVGDGVNLLVASGRAAEQSVLHLHVHVIPRRAGDSLAMNSWLDSKVRSVPDERQRELALLLGPRATA
jgi:histidine triad (HIT) family protein